MESPVAYADPLLRLLKRLFSFPTTAWRWLKSCEPLSRNDLVGLFGVVFGLVGWLLGDSDGWSHVGAFAGGCCLGQVITNRLYRVHNRRMDELWRVHTNEMGNHWRRLVEALIEYKRLDVKDEPPTFTCPRCGAVSHNATDIKQGYCGACHDWTA